MYLLETTNKFEKDYKNQMKSGKNISKLDEIIRRLVNGEILEDKYKNHKLKGNYKPRLECHVEPDWLLIYKIEDNRIIFERTGSHSDIFK